MGLFDAWKIKGLKKNIEKNGCLNFRNAIEHYLCDKKLDNSYAISIINNELIPLIRKQIKDLDNSMRNKMLSYIATFRNNNNYKKDEDTSVKYEIKINKEEIQKNFKKNKYKRIEAEKMIMNMSEAEIEQFLPDWIRNQLGAIKLKNEKKNKILKTGILLDWFGYKDLEYINCGSYNSVWGCKTSNKVYKVCFEEGNGGVSKDQKQNEKIHNLIKENKNSKWTKYLNDSKPIDGIRIFESELAIGDMSHIIKEKNSNKGKSNKTLDSFFHKSKNIIKCVVGLHEQNISVNDLKIENLLKYAKVKYENKNLENNEEYIKKKGIDGKEHWYKKDKNGNLKRIHKNYVQVADLGGFTNINLENKGKEKPIYTSSWQPEDKKSLNTDKETIESRDIYPLGLIMLSFLFRIKVNNRNKNVKEIINKVESKEYDKLFEKLNEVYIKDIYNSQITSILNLISSMLSSDLKKRPKYEDILKIIQRVEDESKKSEQKYMDNKIKETVDEKNKNK